MGVPLGSMTLTSLCDSVPPIYARFVAEAWLKSEWIQAEIPTRESRARERGDGILDPQPASVWDTKHLAHRR
jgi:hypothetical protein